MLPPFARDGAVLLIALTIGAVLAAIAGFFVGVPSLRLRGDYLAIVTLGFGEIIRVFILNIDAVGGARGYSGIPKLANFFWIYLFAGLTILVVHRIVHSSFGRTLVAIREDEIAAEAMGVDTTRAKVISFIVSSAMAGVAGGLFGHYLMYIHTNSFTFLRSFEIIIMIVIGGTGVDQRLDSRRGPLHHAHGGAAPVRPVPDGPLLAPADPAHDHPAAGDPRAPRVRDVPDAPQAAARDGPGHRGGGGLTWPRHVVGRRSRAGATLQLSKVTMRFGGLIAVNALDLQIARGQLYGLIGPNGAGKTTVFNVITGVYTPTSGSIRFEGEDDRGRQARPASRGAASPARSRTSGSSAT